MCVWGVGGERDSLAVTALVQKVLLTLFLRLFFSLVRFVPYAFPHSFFRPQLCPSVMAVVLFIFYLVTFFSGCLLQIEQILIYDTMNT